MTEERFKQILSMWIQDDEQVNISWSFQEADDSDTIRITATLVINVDDRKYSLEVTSVTSNSDESIGGAVQAINDDVLKKLQTIE